MLDLDSPVPLHFQLKEQLLEQIRRGALRPGDQVPTERELCESHGISRAPVRQALLELARTGVLVRQPGRGTFVAAPDDAAITIRVVLPDERLRWPLETAAARWNKAHPQQPIDLDVTLVPLTGLHDHLAQAVARGRAPDISILDSVWVPEFAHRHYLYRLGDLSAAWAGRVRQAFFAPLIAASEYQGALHAVPADADATVLWYRRDWLERERLAPPANWADLVAVGRYFRRPRVRRRYGLGPHPLNFVAGRAGGETTTYQLLPFLWAAGGSLIEDGRVTLDSPAVRQALSFLQDLVHVERLASIDVTAQAWNGAALAFARGEVALAFGGTYESFMIRDAAGWDTATFRARVGFVPLPQGATAANPTLVGGMAYGVFRQTRHPQIALRLLQTALKPEVLRDFSLRTGQYTAHAGVRELLGAGAPEPFFDTAGLFTGAQSRPATPAYDRLSLQFQELIELCLAKRAPIDAAVRRAAERVCGITGLPLAAPQRAA